jgi:hypothetical protein
VTPQTTPLNLIIHFEGGGYDRYPIVGWIPSPREPEVWSPVVAIWDNQAAIAVHSYTTSIMFGDGVRTIATAYLAGAK